MSAQQLPIIIIGAGLSGLATAWYLKKKGKKVTILEASDKIGGVIQTHKKEGFIFEQGPNTGILKYPEVVEMFEDLKDKCKLTIANEAVKRRFILHKGKWQQLPAGLIGGIKTPLFSWYDKFRLLGEPFRKPGNDPDETLADFVKRRMGKSFLEYAVDPFILGVYAGDPELLIPRHALPKLYNLEQEYGSFIGGAIKKQMKGTTEREKKATKEVFSVLGGLSGLINALAEEIGHENIQTAQKNINVTPVDRGFRVQSEQTSWTAEQVILTTGAHEIPSLLPWLQRNEQAAFTSLKYARVAEIALGFNHWKGCPLNGFGGLIPHKEERKLLGALFLSSFLPDRAPEGGALMTLFLGGVRNESLVDLPDEQLKEIVEEEVTDLFDLPDFTPDLFHISRYDHAIPQYGAESEARFATIRSLQKRYPGLYLAGNMRDGIGMADRIKQASDLAESIY